MKFLCPTDTRARESARTKRRSIPSAGRAYLRALIVLSDGNVEGLCPSFLRAGDASSRNYNDQLVDQDQDSGRASEIIGLC